MDPIVIALIVACILIPVCFIIAFFVGVAYRKRIAEAQIFSAENEAKRIINDAIKTAESKKKEALVEAKEDILKSRNEADKETRERRVELQKQDQRLQQKEEQFDKKVDNFERKEEALQERIKENELFREEINFVKKKQMEMLEKISGYSKEQAKIYLLDSLQDDLTHETALRIRDMEDHIKDESDKRAREIIGLAISRCAADHVSEVAVSVVSLPNDEMKGRIIGREGRNIRTLETLTGVDLIIDDTPEAITLSCFDPVRREIARVALEKLISDGRIHPTRIEEMVEKARREVDVTIKQEGERAIFETGIPGVHPEIVKLLGRMRFRSSYGQNVLKHSTEVAHLCGLLAAELGVDIQMAKRAGLLHDIGKSVDHEVEGTHIEIGVDILKKYKENASIIHAVGAHHGDIEATTVLAFIVQAADAISAARPGARRENIESYLKRLEKLEEIASSFEGVEKTFAIQAGREVRILVKPEIVDDDKLVILAREIVKKIEADLQYPGQIKVNVIRENRAIEYAK